MKKKINNIIISTIVILICIGLGTIIYFKFLTNHNNEQEIQESKEINYNDMKRIENVKIEDEKKINISEKVLAERNFEGLKIKNISLISINGMTTFKAIAENTTNKVYNNREIALVFVDSNGTQYDKMGILIEKIEPGETREIEGNITTDISNADDFSIEPVNN